MLNLAPIWGVDIGDTAVKAVKLKRVGKQVAMLDFQVIAYDQLSGEPGARREGMAAEALQALQNAGMGKDKCYISIAPQAVFSRFISLPPVDKRRIPEIVLYEARQQIPFNLDEVIWQYQTVREEFQLGEEIEIGLFAVKREVVESYLAELWPIAKQIQGIQVGPLALHNFVTYSLSLDRPTVVLDIGAQSTDLLIIDGPKFWLRNLPIAGNSFTSALEKRLNIPRAEAEKLKRGIAESRHRRKLLEVLRPVMRDLVAEVQRSIGYYKSLSQEAKFEDIIVLGDGFKLFGLDRFLADQLQYHIDTVDQVENLPWQGPGPREDEFRASMPTLGPAIGLALQGLGEGRDEINLLPDDVVIKRELHAKRATSLVAVALIWAMIGALWVQEGRELQSLQGMANLGGDTLERVQEKASVLREAENQRDTARAGRFEELGAHREYYARVIGALARQMPDVIIEGGFRFITPDDMVMEGGGGMGRYGMEEDLYGGDPGLYGAEREPAEFFGPKGDLSLDLYVKAAGVEKEFLLEELPRALKQATIYEEALPIVKEVMVQEPSRVSIVDATGLSGAEREGLGSRVIVVLVAPDEVDSALAEHRKALAEAARETGGEEPSPGAGEATETGTEETAEPEAGDATGEDADVNTE